MLFEIPITEERAISGQCEITVQDDGRGIERTAVALETEPQLRCAPRY